MNKTFKTKSGWRILRRILIGLAILATLIAVFYTEEDWRGKRAWENYKQELEAKSVVLDWAAYIPPPVPDNQNFFKAPKMAEWFLGRGATELSKRLQSTNESVTASVGAASNLIATAEAAKNYLAWSDQFEPDFDLIRQALKRPYARMGGDYSQPYNVPIPNFITVRALTQMLAQRAHCDFLLGEPQKALEELTFLNDWRRFLEGAPTGKPMTLVAAMINVAVIGVYSDMIAEGFRLHLWQDPQLVLLQDQLSRINLIPFVSSSFREMPVHDYEFIKQLETANRRDRRRLVSFMDVSDSWMKHWNDPLFLLFNVAPRGWIDQNLIQNLHSEEKMLDALDASNALVYPRRVDAAMQEIRRDNLSHSPYRILAAIAVPDYSRAFQTLAHNQAEMNEAVVACALERYRLGHGQYPETLEALSPQFIEKLPHDIINGQPLHYRRTDDGKFVLYSIGWNEKDDGGNPSPRTPKGSMDYTQGDWVWQYPGK
jgi:hypothetical protein